MNNTNNPKKIPEFFIVIAIAIGFFSGVFALIMWVLSFLYGEGWGFAVLLTILSIGGIYLFFKNPVSSTNNSSAPVENNGESNNSYNQNTNISESATQNNTKKSKNNTNNSNIRSIIGCIVFFLSIAFFIHWKFEIEFKYTLIGVGILFLGSLCEVYNEQQGCIYKAVYTVNGQPMTETIRANSEYEVKNLIYSKYPGQNVENISIIKLSSR